MSEDEIVLYDNAKPMIWVMGVASTFFGLLGLGAVLAATQIGLAGDPLLAGILGVVGAVGFVGFGLAGLVAYRRTRAPLLVLTPDHLSTSRFQDPIPWTDIEEYGIFASQRLNLRLNLVEDAPLPTKRGVWLLSKIHARRRVVTIDAFGIRGMKVDAFSELIGRYLQAAYARRELARVDA